MEEKASVDKGGEKAVISKEDVVQLVATITCQSPEIVRAQLAAAAGVMEAAVEPCQQLSAGASVVLGLDAGGVRHRLAELALRERTALSFVPSAAEVRYHELHAPLRTARQAIRQAMAPVVETTALIERFPALRVALDTWHEVSPRLLGAAELRAIVVSSIA